MAQGQSTCTVLGRKRKVMSSSSAFNCIPCPLAFDHVTLGNKLCKIRECSEQRQMCLPLATCHLTTASFSLYAMFRNYLKSKLHPHTHTLTHTHTRIIAWAFYCFALPCSSRMEVQQGCNSSDGESAVIPCRGNEIIYEMYMIGIINILKTYATMRKI